MQGRIVRWDDERGFGFIQMEPAGPDVFVHINEIQNRTSRRPAAGDRVEFDLGHDENGRTQAVDVHFLIRRVTFSAGATRALLLGVAYLVLIGIYGSVVGVPLIVNLFVIGLYARSSWLAYRYYEIDKARAQTSRWRVPEVTLLRLGLGGGWPGALFAQQRLRHKTVKGNFQYRFIATVLINVIGTVVLYTSLPTVIRFAEHRLHSVTDQVDETASEWRFPWPQKSSRREFSPNELPVIRPGSH